MQFSNTLILGGASGVEEVRCAFRLKLCGFSFGLHNLGLEMWSLWRKIEGGRGGTAEGGETRAYVQENDKAENTSVVFFAHIFSCLSSTLFSSSFSHVF